MVSSTRLVTGALHEMHSGAGFAVVRASLPGDSGWNAFPMDLLVAAQLAVECWACGEAGVAKVSRRVMHREDCLAAGHAQSGGDGLVRPGELSGQAAWAHLLQRVLGALPPLASTWGAVRQSPAGHQRPTMNGLPRGCRAWGEGRDGPNAAFQVSGPVSMGVGTSGCKDCGGVEQRGGFGQPGWMV